MDKFHSPQFEVVEQKTGDDVRVVKQEGSFVASVQEFEVPDLHAQAKKGYAQVKAHYGAFAATDPDRAAKSRKDRRFSLNELARGPLSVEEEERRVIEERVRARIAALSDEVREKGFQAGYEEGLKKGHEEAFQRFQEEASNRLGALDALLAEMERAKADIFRANERFLIELIYRVSRLVLMRELSADPQFLLRLTRELIERVGVRENIRIRINPKDKETIEMLRAGLDQAFGGLKNVNIEVSNQVTHGGCMMDTEWNAIDASIDNQLKGIYEALLGQEALATAEASAARNGSSGSGSAGEGIGA